MSRVVHLRRTSVVVATVSVLDADFLLLSVPGSSASQLSDSEVMAVASLAVATLSVFAAQRVSPVARHAAPT